MKRLVLLFTSALIIQSASAQNLLNKASNAINNAASGASSGSGKNLSNDEVVKGLREALTIGSGNAAGSASKPDGFLKNNLIKIPFPKEAKIVETKARQIGMGSQVDRFVTTMNRAAEEASKEAKPVFINAIKTMSITDGISILRGGDNAATTFLKGRTSAELTNKFSPIVKRAIQKVQLTKFWKPIITGYNKIPGVKRQNPDLDRYVTEKTLEGLFTLLGQEEAKIRKDPVAQVTDLLRRVFGGK
jgi:hypothetical protein